MNDDDDEMRGSRVICLCQSADMFLPVRSSVTIIVNTMFY